MLSPQRCSLNQEGEEYELLDPLAPAQGILTGILISMALWTSLGLVMSRLDGVRCRTSHARTQASFVHSAAGNDRR
jgi:hypothetical protein